MEIASTRTDDIINYVNNTRIHSETQVDQIAASIAEFSFCNPILIDEFNVIIAGHARLSAAKKLKLEEVPTITLSHLSEAQKKAYIIADNQLPNNAEWDLDLLKVELERLGELEFDVGLIGFDADFLEMLDTEEPIEGLTDEDEVPEVPEVPVTVLGDLWVLGGHRLLCGDSTSIDAVEKLMDGQKADMVFTDPPYGVDYDGGHATEKRREKLQGDNDTALYIPCCEMAFNFTESNAPLYLWHAGVKGISAAAAAAAAGYEIRAEIIWNKNLAQFGAISAHYKQKHEPCFYCFKKGKSSRWGGV